MGRLLYFWQCDEMTISFLKKRHLGGLGVFVVILLVTSCVTTEEKLYLNQQIVSLNNRVNSLESADQGLSSGLDTKFQSLNEKQQKIDSSLDSIRDRQAENVAEMDRIRLQLQTLTGRVEENNHLVKRTVERDTTEQDEGMRRLSELAERVDKLEASMRHLNSYLGLEPRGGVAKQDAEKPPKEVSTHTTPPPPVAEKEPVSPENRLYELTLKLYRDGKYEEAIEGFRNFLKKYRKSDLADNAQFWIGESNMSLNQYEQAILAYQRVIKKYPEGNKVPNAMLRQALAFSEIKDKTSSKILLKKIIKKYPKSNEAKIAEARLKQMR